MAIVFFALYSVTHARAPSPTSPPPTFAPAFGPDSVGPFIGKLTAIFGAPIGVILGGIFAGRSADSPAVDRSLVMLLYVLSVAWGAIVIGATVMALVTPANVIDAIGPGVAV